MKVFSILGLVTLVCAESEVAIRRRLAITKCSFPDLRKGALNPNCMGKFSWTMSESTGDVDVVSLAKHPYRCCIDKHPGWTTTGKLQQACTDVGTQLCKDIKADDAKCQAASSSSNTFFPHGYKYTAECKNQYSDDCRASLTCDTAGGFKGYPDLACKTGFNSQFKLRGCGRGDVGILGSDLTTDVFIVAPHTAPKQTGNAKNSFAECEGLAAHYKVNAFYAGNGGCDQDNQCNGPDSCAVIPTFDKVLTASESDDTWLKPFLFRSQLNERCITVNHGKQPTGLETEKDCTGNTASNTDLGKYGGFDLYGERLNCWRNLGGGIQTKTNGDMQQLDLTYEVMTSSVNAGIGITLEKFANVGAHSGIWNGGENGIGYGVCNGVDKSLGGCTAELAAIMCEAYNKKLVNDGAKNSDNFCVGFVLSESDVVGLGNTAKKKNFPYVAVHDHDMLVGFFSKTPADIGWNSGANFDGGYFKYVPIANCLVTSTVSCSRCEKCEDGFSRTSEGTCVESTKCPKFQYNNNGVCTYRTPHCIEGNADGTECTKCHTGYGPSIDKKTCEETGCAVPASMKSAKGDDLIGAEQGSSPACSPNDNLVPGTGSCGVTCGTGKYSNDNKKTHVYSCPSKGAPTAPTITCAVCTVGKCSSCPSNPLCDTCENGHVLATDKKKCDAKACPNTGSPGSCTVCPEGTAGTLTWDLVAQDWDTSACETCTVENCKDCKGDKAACQTCTTGYTQKTALKKECIKLDDCPYGTKGVTTWDIAKGEFVTTGCKLDTTACEDTTQTAGKCTDCKDGFAGSVDWDFAKQEFNNNQCHAVACPLSSETSPLCKKCPEFTTGTPVWDDLFNEWVGCIANDFGFSGPSASWAGSVSADRHVIETISAEMLHVANSQYDAIKEKWICDEGYAGEGCKQRLCPETVAFTSGMDGFTPSKSTGTSFATDAASGTSGTFNNQHSYRQCGGRGSCDFETGICQCFPGFTGVACRRTTCPNSCSGHGVCVNDDVSNYHAAGNAGLPSDDIDINTWGNLWASDKFQGCQCDGGWGGNDCSLRQCPRGDDPETQCADELGDDIQYIECTNMFATKESYFKLRFTDLLGNRYNTRAVVIRAHTATPTDLNKAVEGPKYTKAGSHSIQTALESLPNFAVPKVEVTSTQAVPAYKCTTERQCSGPKKKQVCNDVDVCDYAAKYTLKFELKFTDARNSGQQSLLEVVDDMKCASGVQPKFANADTFNPTCTVTRNPSVGLRENTECANRGLCNRKTAECNCFDGYTGLACDIVAQTY